jgi:hypothetical protein
MRNKKATESKFSEVNKWFAKLDRLTFIRSWKTGELSPQRRRLGMILRVVLPTT